MSEVKIVLIGDTYISRPDPDSAFNPVIELFQDADIRFCNLETIVADAKYINAYDRTDLPRTDEWMLKAYVRAGINVVNQANNPNTFHGYEPLLRSFKVIDEAGIIRAGAGRNLVEARKPAIIERNGTKVAFVCRTSVGIPEMAAGMDLPGVAYYPVYTSYEAPERVRSHPGFPPIVRTILDQGEHRSALEDDIRSARKQADFVVVYWHWGLSPYQIHPGAGAGEVDIMEYQKDGGHFAIDCGADMVLGGHSHQPQPIEIYKGKPILYSLANYVHDKASFRELSSMTILVRCLLRKGKLERLAYIPGTLRGSGPPEFARPSSYRLS